MMLLVHNYITSERFIWDDLQDYAERVLEEVKKKWVKHRTIPTMILSWPAVEIKDDKGRTISNTVALDVPPTIPTSKALRDLAVRTESYALLLCEASDTELRLVLESHHGVKAWLTPVERHGDVKVLGTTRVVEGEGGFNLLWNQKKNSG